MAKVFFSYSHKDEALRDELEINLSALKRQGIIETWHDRRIGPGKHIDREIDANLADADIILFLVSPHFIASDYCYDVEIRRAVERHNAGDARVIPVILRPCEWQHTLFGNLRATPLDGKPVTKFDDPNDAFLLVAKDIRKVAEEMSEVRSKRQETFRSLQRPDSLDKTSTSDSQNSNMFETVHIYPCLDAAEPDIRDSCAESEDIKIFANKGLRFFGSDDSIIPLHQITSYTKLRKIRIILLHPNSRHLSRGFMALRKRESLDDIQNELKNNHEIVESAMMRISPNLNTKSAIRYHHGEPYFRMIITEHAAFVSSYTEVPSIQVARLPVYRFIKDYASLYGPLKRYFNDIWHNYAQPGNYETSMIETESSAGGIVVASFGADKYIALLQRDDGTWVLPKGHKRKGDLDLKSTALREVSEELGLPESKLRIDRRLDDYAYDETAKRYGEKKMVRIYLFQLVDSASTPPRLHPDPDHITASWWRVGDPWPEFFYTYQRILIGEIADQLFLSSQP